MDKLKKVQEALESVLCDLEGRCCINGSDKDREIVNRALAELREFREGEPDYYCNADDWEYSHCDVNMIEDYMAYNGKDIVRLGRLRKLSDKFIAQVYDEESGETEYPQFDTLEKAQAAIKPAKE